MLFVNTVTNLTDSTKYVECLNQLTNCQFSRLPLLRADGAGLSMQNNAG